MNQATTTLTEHDVDSSHFFIAIHGGAGFHAHSKESEYKHTMSSVLVAVEAYLRHQLKLKHHHEPSCLLATKAVKLAIKLLEDSEQMNAGWGSNLTAEGTVECDASVMNGYGRFAAVGAVPGVKNPISLAFKLLKEQEKGLSLGRIPPMVLVGEGARRWALDHGIRNVAQDPQEATTLLVSESAKKTWTNHKQRVADYERECEAESVKRKAAASLPSTPTTSIKRRRVEEACETKEDKEEEEEEESAEDQSQLNDTVGAVCVLGCGCVAAGVSSGGISLKSCGRVGEAACYGCGCWAENRQPKEKGKEDLKVAKKEKKKEKEKEPSNDEDKEEIDDDEPKDLLHAFACSVSGTGEHIIRQMVAKECVRKLRRNTSEDEEVVMRRMMQKFSEREGEAAAVGLVAISARVLRRPTDKVATPITQTKGVFLWSHTTPSMAIGYASNATKAPKVFISRLKASASVVCQILF